jgi:hypothetical protein
MHAALIGVIAAAPDDEDVVAGPMGFIIFIALVIAVALLGWSLTRQLKKANRAADAGVYGDPVATVSDDPAEREAPKGE